MDIIWEMTLIIVQFIALVLFKKFQHKGLKPISNEFKIENFKSKIKEKITNFIARQD